MKENDLKTKSKLAEPVLFKSNDRFWVIMTKLEIFPFLSFFTTGY